MRFYNRAAFTAAVIMAVFACQALAGEEGGYGAGNGGDAIAIEFQLVGRKLVADLKANPAIDRRGVDLAELESTIESKDVKYVSTEDQIKLRGERKDAINIDGNTIVVSLTHWKELNPVVRQVMVLHEYLGLTGDEIGHYQISIALVEDLINASKSGAKWRPSKSEARKLEGWMLDLRESMREAAKGGENGMDELVDEINAYFDQLESLKKREKSSTRLLEKNTASALRCSRRIVERKKGGYRGVEVALRYLDSLGKALDLATLEEKVVKSYEIAESCKSNLKKLERRKTTRDAQLAEIEKLSGSYSEGAVGLARDFVAPTLNCGHFGVGGAFALGVGVGANARAAVCLESSGRKWVELGLAAGIYYGFGVSALEIQYPFEGDYGERRKGSTPVRFSGHIHTYSSQLILMASCDGFTLSDALNSEDCMHAASNGNAFDIRSVGFGVGDFSGAEARLHLTLVPLGTDWKALARRL